MQGHVGSTHECTGLCKEYLAPAYREKLQGCEGKLRSAVQDKANVVSEKATIDRQLKALQAQTGKLTKVLNLFIEHMSSPRARRIQS